MKILKLLLLSVSMTGLVSAASPSSDLPGDDAPRPFSGGGSAAGGAASSAEGSEAEQLARQEAEYLEMVIEGRSLPGVERVRKLIRRPIGESSIQVWSTEDVMRIIVAAAYEDEGPGSWQEMATTSPPPFFSLGALDRVFQSTRSQFRPGRVRCCVRRQLFF